MAQSSGTRPGDKRAPDERGTRVIGRLMRTGLAGLVLLLPCAWYLRHLLARIPARELAVLLVLLAGAALLGGAIVAAAGPESAVRPADAAILGVLRGLGQGDLTQELALSPSDATPGQARISNALRNAQAAVKTMISELRTSTREAVTRAQDVSSQAGALASTSQRAAEGAAAAATHGTELRQAAALARDASGSAITSVDAMEELVREGERREGRLRDATREGARLLRTESEALDTLAARLRESAGEIESLAAASEEIRGFVTLVRKMARQSKLLALNASMEAARAGDQGSGFAVVAGEVRRLAKSSNEAADRTDALVSDLLARIERIRASSEEAVGQVLTVRGAAVQSLDQLRGLDEAFGEQGHSPASTDRLAARGPVDALAARIEALAHGLVALSATLAEHASQLESQHGRVLDLSAATGALTRQAGRAAAAANAFRTDASSPPLAPGVRDSRAEAGGSAAGTGNSRGETVAPAAGAPARLLPA